MKAHNEKTDVIPVNIMEGDFVLVRRPKQNQYKLSLQCRGPKRISKVLSDRTYKVEDFLIPKKEKYLYVDSNFRDPTWMEK